MANFTIPNRPAQSDQRDITLIEADFDAVTGILDSVVANRRLLWRATAFLGNLLSASTGVISNGVLSPSGSQISQAFEWLYIDPANYVSYTGKSASMFFRLEVALGIAPGITITLQLAPLTLGGAGGGITPTAGGVVVAGSGVSVTTSNSHGTDIADGGGAPFPVPAAGAYVPSITTSGATAANSAGVITAELFLKYT